jgi:hypothetical protein
MYPASRPATGIGDEEQGAGALGLMSKCRGKSELSWLAGGAGAPGPDVRAAGVAGAGVVRAAQARVTSMATGTGLLTMSRTGE